MIIIKNKAALEKMRTAGKKLASVMQEVSNFLEFGKTTLEINDFIEQRMRAVGLVCQCIGYAGYKYASCISVNDAVVHGVPSQSMHLKDGDFVKIDVVGSYKGYCADMARYFFIGTIDPAISKLAQTAQKALDGAIEMIKPGIYLSDLSAYIQQTVEQEGFGIVRDFVGHGIGKAIHEPPEVPNFGKKGQGPLLREGMTLAIEPMITQRSCKISIMNDGWTVKTCDGGFAAHVEDTVLVTNDGSEIFTRLSYKV